MVIHSCKMQFGIFVLLFRALIGAVRKLEHTRRPNTEDLNGVIGEFADRCAEWVDFTDTTGGNGQDGMDWSAAWAYIRRRLKVYDEPTVSATRKDLARLLYRQLRAIPMQRPRIVLDHQVESRLRRCLRAQMATAEDLGREVFWHGRRETRRGRRSSDARKELHFFVRRATIPTDSQGLFGLGLFGRVFHSQEQVPSELADDIPLKNCLADGSPAVVVFWTDPQGIPKDARRKIEDYFLLEFGLCHEIATHVAVPTSHRAHVATGSELHGWLTFALLAHLSENARSTWSTIDELRASSYRAKMVDQCSAEVARWFGVCQRAEEMAADVSGWMKALECLRERCFPGALPVALEDDKVFLPCPSPATRLLTLTRRGLARGEEPAVSIWCDRPIDRMLARECMTIGTDLLRHDSGSELPAPLWWEPMASTPGAEPPE